MERDWLQFHNLYDTWPALQARLRAVQEQIAAAMTAAPAGPIGILSLCAGDGRDLLGALAAHPRCSDVCACLVENNGELVDRGEAARMQLDLPAVVRFLHADATRSDTYGAAAPADIVIVAGVFGNLQRASVMQLVRSLRSLCKTGGSVIWTHKTHDLASEYTVALIGQLFQEADFHEQTLVRTEPAGFIVATHTFLGQEEALPAGVSLFEFPVAKP